MPGTDNFFCSLAYSTPGIRGFTAVPVLSPPVVVFVKGSVCES
jgi:hypothetical protein